MHILCLEYVSLYMCVQDGSRRGTVFIRSVAKSSFSSFGHLAEFLGVFTARTPLHVIERGTMTDVMHRVVVSLPFVGLFFFSGVMLFILSFDYIVFIWITII